MKRIKQLTCQLALGTLLACSAYSQTIIDTWSADGGAWVPGNQPSFVAQSPGGGILYTDEAIAAGTNNALENTGATWSSTILPPQGGPTGNQGVGIYDDYYYTVFSTPDITLATNNVLSSVDVIKFTLVSNTPLTSSSVTLDYGGAQTPVNFTVTDLGPFPGFPTNVYSYVYTWDVSALAQEGDFSIAWTTGAIHSAYFSAEIAQTVVPEPTSAVLLAVGVTGMVVSRRRRNVR